MGLNPSKIFTGMKFFLDSIHIPFVGISLFKLFEVYVAGIFKNQILKEATSISWSLFMSIFPFILFMLSLLPYLPHYESLQSYIFDVLMVKILPENILDDVTDYLKTYIIPNIEKLNKFTLLLALIFGANGAYAFIAGFNANTQKKRHFVVEYILSFGITIAFVVVIIFSFLGIYYSEVVLKVFTPKQEVSGWFVNNLSEIIGYFSFPLFYFALLVLFYWVGSIEMTKWVQAIPGAGLSTVLFLLLTYLFAIYLRNFARYNFLYGSIGSILIVMIWLNINVIVILLGNELNLVIKKMRLKKLHADQSKEIRK
ncbi:MAG: YihY/virulence factor BrkB family protein [Bergeyella sp.]|nr:YihY/virulence factor BrkB family protein [Bergeyella sp.]